MDVDQFNQKYLVLKQQRRLMISIGKMDKIKCIVINLVIVIYILP